MHLKNESSDQNIALVQHLFKGTWNADHPLKNSGKPKEQSDAPQGHADLSKILSEDRQEMDW